MCKDWSHFVKYLFLQTKSWYATHIQLQGKDLLMGKERKNILKRSLRGKMLLLAVLPVVFLAILLGFVSTRSFTTAMLGEVKTDMANQCHMIADIYDRMYPGAFNLEVLDEANYNLYKGQVDITNACQIIDSIHDAYNVEVSIFRSDLCIVTTMKDASDDRLTLTKASPIVVSGVLETGEEQFYSDVILNDEKYFAYFMPIPSKNGDEIFGMYAICRLASDVHALVLRSVLPVILLCLLATIVIGLISIRYSQKIVGYLQQIQRFMRALSGGKFDVELSPQVLALEDELGDLAKSGQSMQRSLRLLVEFDALPGLYNRRLGDLRLRRAAKRAADYGMDYCVGICDIDFFKKVNDTYGHEAGDAVLKAVARLLKRNMTGKKLTVARWGGEEFLVLFEDCKLPAAYKILQEIHAQVHETTVEHEGQSIRVTMSMGLVQADRNASEDAMLAAADALLYYCKEHGRDQIQVKDMTKEEK